MRFFAATVLSVGIALVGCSKKDETPTTTSASAPAAPSAPAPTAVAPPPVAAPAEVETTADMKAFMTMLDGTEGATRKALNNYGSKATQTNDLGMYSLKTPKVTKAEKLGALQCYTMESSAGVTKHTTRTCWDSSGKIAQITDKAQ